VHETAQYSGEGTYFNTTVFWVRQDLPYVAMLDTVDLKPTTREHFTEQVRPSLCTSDHCFAMARRKSQNAQNTIRSLPEIVIWRLLAARGGAAGGEGPQEHLHRQLNRRRRGAGDVQLRRQPGRHAPQGRRGLRHLRAHEPATALLHSSSLALGCSLGLGFRSIRALSGMSRVLGRRPGSSSGSLTSIQPSLAAPSSGAHTPHPTNQPPSFKRGRGG